MHRVTNRTWLTRVLVLLLLAGMIFFLWEYVTQARIWVSFPGSPHIYSNGNIGTGTVTGSLRRTAAEHLGQARLFNCRSYTQIHPALAW